MKYTGIQKSFFCSIVALLISSFIAGYLPSCPDCGGCCSPFESGLMLASVFGIIIGIFVFIFTGLYLLAEDM